MAEHGRNDEERTPTHLLPQVLRHHVATRSDTGVGEGGLFMVPGTRGRVWFAWPTGHDLLVDHLEHHSLNRLEYHDDGNHLEDQGLLRLACHSRRHLDGRDVHIREEHDLDHLGDCFQYHVDAMFAVATCYARAIRYHAKSHNSANMCASAVLYRSYRVNTIFQ